jgi:hypothetical protein
LLLANGLRLLRPYTDHVRDRPGIGVAVVLEIRGFVTAEKLHLEFSCAQIKLGLGSALEVLGCDNADP